MYEMKARADLSDESSGDASRGLPILPLLGGEVVFASPETQAQRVAELRGGDALVVFVPSPASSARGGLAAYIDDLIEHELALRGAPSPYLAAWSAMPEGGTERLADQLFRARTLGASGLAIAMGSLAPIAVPALTPEDSAMLRRFADAAEDSPLVVLLDDADAWLGAHAEPVPLARMIAAATVRVAPSPTPVAAAAPSPAPEVRDVPEVASDEIAAPREARSHDDDHDDDHSPHEPDIEVTAPLSMPPALDEPRPMSVAEIAAEAARARATVGVPVARGDGAWRAWALALAAARGPQPLGAFERLFTESYLPLSTAIQAGLDEPRAIRAYEDFRRGFERTYSDAFAAFGATNRRPRLVMDAFDLAARQARLHNARTAHVLVVDSMHWRIGAAVRDAVTQTASSASLTSEGTLWAALPTTTFRQLETLARGVDALRAPVAPEAADSLRGRTAETVRRLRVGSRELYKLDVIPSVLDGISEVSGGDPEHVKAVLDEAAESVATALVRHLESLAPRTLVFVVGDHGFVVDRRGRVTSGGASPEEVLVPAFSWFIGELH